ncbi:primosomal protein N' [uncultured Albimonas sp.]|uniref:primosomal protein N' n=1 Tax=uncultured Albimonas sp. TaxID=1331701 RepID=UPI0030ED3A78|tara:strand:- start:767 stop:3028 length:2262 start_codon:yes stop_codon:yes gene_type:complete
MTDSGEGRTGDLFGGPAIGPAPPGGWGEGAAVAVLVPIPVDRTLDYLAPVGGCAPGDWLEVEVGPRVVVALCWGPGTGEVARAKLRPALRRLDLPPVTAEMRAFLEKAADYTLTDFGMMARLASRAPGLREAPGARRALRRGGEPPARLTPAREKVLELVEAEPDRLWLPGELAREAGVSSAVLKGLEKAGALASVEVPRDRPYAPLDLEAPRRTLSEAQEAGAQALCAKVVAAAEGRFSATLLHGVTGSGKTEVYLEAVAECLSRGRQALVLLPEIALTSAFLARFHERFGAPPAEWHSAAPEIERRRCWRAAASGEAQVVVGARSALFLPFADLGLIVVDEEHDGAYKQEDGALYHARDMAVLRGSLGRAAVVLASATPSLETWVNARTGRYDLVDLPERFGPAVLPEIRALDLRDCAPETGRWISDPLAQAVVERLGKGEQSLLFLNRRGYAPLTMCRACGDPVMCPHCDAWLVEHRRRGRMVCHQCGHEAAIPTACPTCGREDKLALIGPGVERLAEEAQERFPEARIAILSSDMAESAGAVKARIEAIAAGEADLVIGTQLVAKGHNFPLLTLVGVIDADLGLRGGDLRAGERTFQLLRQVAGRAGRADRPGEALLQTYAPEHPALEALLSGDEETFLQTEADARREAGAPPFGRYAAAIVSGPHEDRVWRTAEALARAHDQLAPAHAELLGPAPAPIYRVRGRFRVRLLVKAPRGPALQPALRAWRGAVRPEPQVTVRIDVDPQSFL